MKQPKQSNSSRPCAWSACACDHVTSEKLFVLIACEESQAECIAFRNLGHIAYSCDLQTCRPGGYPEWHIHGDVRPFLHGKTEFYTQAGGFVHVPRWDLIICHPPCTYLCKVGSPWMHKNSDAVLWSNGRLVKINSQCYENMRKGRDFFMECLFAEAKYVAVENPIPMALAQLPKATCFACPSWFGVKYTKKTLYWLKNLPPIFAEYIHSRPKCYVNSSRGKYRSRTFPQMANAIAKQWSDYILNEI